tara:strand:- start:2515 stop:3429 length:915 start_codon:yes stop_codon:yes gene_type:complete
MCLKSNPFAGASGTSWADFALGAGQSFIGWNKEREEVNLENRNRLLAYETARQNYHTDYREKVIGWKNTNLDDAIEVDNAYKESLSKLAESKLKVWETIKQGTIAEQEAFAAMMSVGGGEQTGRRSGQTTSRRQAVMAYGQAMNKIAIAKSSTRDNAALFSSQVRDAFATLAHSKDIKSGTSRPVYAAPKTVWQGYKKGPSVASLMFQVGRNALDSKMLFDKLNKDEGDSSSNYTAEEPMNVNSQTPTFAETPLPSHIENNWAPSALQDILPTNDNWGMNDVSASYGNADRYLGKSSQATFITT